MKKAFFLGIFALALALIPIFGQEEYTLFYRGDTQGTITIQRDRDGKFAISGRLLPKYAYAIIDHALCPLIPAGISETFYYTTKSIIIDSNTTTKTDLDGSWIKWIRDSSTMTTISSDGSWSQEVTNGNTMTMTTSDGRWTKTVTNGNTTTETNSDGSWKKTVIDRQDHNIYITKESGGN